MNQVKLDSREMKDFLKHIIDNNRHIQSKGLTPVATEITGESGLGKTSVILQLGKELNLPVVKVNLAMIEELGDLIGFPVRQFQMTKSVNTLTDTIINKIEPKYHYVDKKLPNGKIVKIKEEIKIIKPTCENPIQTSNEKIWIDENAVNQYTKTGYTFTGRKRMSYCPPEWIADKKNGGILLLDDYTRADTRFLQATMELIDRQKYISWKLPKDWHIILSTNPDDGNYLVQSIDTAQKTRFISVVMKWNHERWAEWAEEQQIDNRCINFVLMNPEIITPEVNPRAITTFFNSINSFPKFEEKLPIIQMIGEGSVGPEVATLFTTFINNRLDKLITPKDILLKSDNNVVKQELLNAICNGNIMNDYRADIASVLTTRLINYATLYASENSISPNNIDRLLFLIKDPDIFTDDLKYHLVKKLLNANKQKFQRLLIDTTVQEYVTK